MQKNLGLRNIPLRLNGSWRSLSVSALGLDGNPVASGAVVALRPPDGAVALPSGTTARRVAWLFRVGDRRTRASSALTECARSPMLRLVRRLGVGALPGAWRREEGTNSVSTSEFVVRCCVAGLAGYLFGSFPSGVLIGQLLGGRDPRAAGSGKTGATNVLRTMGVGPAACVALLDLAKGVASVMATRYLVFTAGVAGATTVIGPLHTTPQSIAEAIAGLCALLGHNYSIFLKFSGGRGVLTGAGGILAMSPISWLFGLICAVVPIARTRYVSLGSILGAIGCPTADLVMVLLGRDSLPHLLFMMAGGTIVIVSHKDNIARLRAGTERKLGEKVALPVTTRSETR